MNIIKKITQQQEESLTKYFKELKFKLLTIEEEVELFARYRNHKDLSARDKILKSNLRFVISCAKNFQNNSSNLSLEDLIGYGNIGLCNAVEKYEATKGFKFITYAVWHIRQQIILALQKHQNILKVPAYHADILQKINKEFDKFNNQNQREPNIIELVDMDIINESEMSVYVESLGHINYISLNQPFGFGKKNDHEQEMAYETVVADKNMNEIDIFINNQHNSTIIKNLLNKSNLKNEQIEIINKKFGIGCESSDFNKISNDLNLSLQKVTLLYNNAIFKLNKKILKLKI